MLGKISNSCYFQGYTIPLDKRLAADGRGLQQVHINENFAKLAEALYIADRKVRIIITSFCELCMQSDTNMTLMKPNS
jgi:SNW domain-containing protein 1